MLNLGLLTFEGNTASQASSILNDMLKHHVGPQSLSIGTDQASNDDSQKSLEGNAIKSTCAVFENALSAADGIPNEHVLSVISVLFLELGMELSLTLLACHIGKLLFPISFNLIGLSCGLSDTQWHNFVKEVTSLAS